MNLQLTTLGQTLALGGFALYTIIHLLKILQPRWVPHFVSSSDSNLQLQYVPVYLALVFGTGILLEAASKRVVTRDSPTDYNFLANALDTDQSLRVRSLFLVKELRIDEPVESDNYAEIKPRAIATELILMDAPPKPLLDHFIWIKKLIEEGEKEVKEKQLQDTLSPISVDAPTVDYQNGYFRVNGRKAVGELLSHVNGLYYGAKNHAYAHDTYFQELSEIEGRVIFTRAFAVLCLCLTGIYILCSLALLVFLVVNRKKNKQVAEGEEQAAWDAGISKLTNPKNPTNLAGRSTYWAHLGGLSCLYFACYLLAAYSFRSEHWNLDTRSFAYSQSLTMNAKPNTQTSASTLSSPATQAPAPGNAEPKTPPPSSEH